MSIILFARHGESRANSDHYIALPDSPLTELGKQQAKNLGQQLESLGITKVVSSPALSAQETTQIVVNYLKLNDREIRIIPDLNERNLGELRGKPKTHPSEFFYTIEADTVSKSETVDELIHRMQKCWVTLQEIAQNNTGSLLAVGHDVSGNFLRQVVFQRLNFRDFVGLDSLDNAEYIELTNAGTS